MSKGSSRRRPDPSHALTCERAGAHWPVIFGVCWRCNHDFRDDVPAESQPGADPSLRERDE